jgi:hypothetical protein
VNNPVFRKASERAWNLLAEHLDAQQLQDFKERGFFVVRAQSGIEYKIRYGEFRNIRAATGWTLCAYPDGDMPIFDVLLAQKLMLEHDETRFLKSAVFYLC